jgi:hypothetical protein
LRELWGKRHEIAVKRLQSVLRSHAIANARILEQKISDAGPGPMRVNPHILTEARDRLILQNTLAMRRALMPWYYLTSSPPDVVESRFKLLVALQKEAQAVSASVGQALEIAVVRALRAQTELVYFGDFIDLGVHEDSRLYRKEEPPASLSGRRIPGRKQLDFLVHNAAGIYAGIEVKNVREWFYPDRDEIRELLLKCCALDVVPVLIARRVQFSAFSVLNPCGVILHQTFNQLYPNSTADLTVRLRDKHLLGFHDIRLIDGPDASSMHGRLAKFIGENLPQVLPEARAKFDEYKDLLSAYANEQYDYAEFAARARRRQKGEPEDLPSIEPGDFDIPDDWT